MESGKKTENIISGSFKRNFSLKQHLIPAIIIGVLLIALVAMILVNTLNKSNTSNINIPYIPGNLTPLEKAEYFANNNNYVDAEAVLENQLSSTRTTQDKVNIYNEQFGIALQLRKYGDAINYANSIKKIDSSSDSYYVDMAQSYQGQGKFSLAKQYWQQAVSHLDSNLSYYNILKQEYQANAARLK